MLFPTVDFALFFCLVFLGHWVLNHNAPAVEGFMIAASYVFYGWWDARYVLLLVGVTVVAQLAAIAVAHQEDQRRRIVGDGGRRRRARSRPCCSSSTTGSSPST